MDAPENIPTPARMERWRNVPPMKPYVEPHASERNTEYSPKTPFRLRHALGKTAALLRGIFSDPLEDDEAPL